MQHKKHKNRRTNYEDGDGEVIVVNVNITNNNKPNPTRSTVQVKLTSFSFSFCFVLFAMWLSHTHTHKQAQTYKHARSVLPVWSSRDLGNKNIFFFSGWSSPLVCIYFQQTNKQQFCVYYHYYYYLIFLRGVPERIFSELFFLQLFFFRNTFPLFTTVVFPLPFLLLLLLLRSLLAILLSLLSQKIVSHIYCWAKHFSILSLLIYRIFLFFSFFLSIFFFTYW